ncbi:uncharacterized protein LOC126910244 [Daktulosphaira vitifoliae]|uniref:uncharacterized protein LOC126910244 n=1 Tax=Daktulosphaira vitifoliae TaxID=58002 RepID=UPI0021AA6103|nr:uncharacterized protein LOC126910244 [Daktulosphaira vitifoliae]
MSNFKSLLIQFCLLITYHSINASRRWSSRRNPGQSSRRNSEVLRLPISNTLEPEDVYTLQPSCDIKWSIIDNSIRYLIGSNENKDNIFYIPSYIYYAYSYLKLDNILVKFISEANVLNKHIILVSINSNPEINSTQWILGVFYLKLHKIIILDSNINRNTLQRHHFKNLVKILRLSYRILSYSSGEDNNIDLDDWQLIYASDAFQQNMATWDSGLYTCIHANCIIQKIFSMNFNREWLRQIYDASLSCGIQSGYDLELIKNNMSDEEIQQIIEEVCDDELSIKFITIQNLIMNQ